MRGATQETKKKRQKTQETQRRGREKNRERERPRTGKKNREEHTKKTNTEGSKFFAPVSSQRNRGVRASRSLGTNT
jgi:hypothetical protein